MLYSFWHHFLIFIVNGKYQHSFHFKEIEEVLLVAFVKPEIRSCQYIPCVWEIRSGSRLEYWCCKLILSLHQFQNDIFSDAGSFKTLIRNDNWPQVSNIFKANGTMSIISHQPQTAQETQNVAPSTYHSWCNHIGRYTYRTGAQGGNNCYDLLQINGKIRVRMQ